MIAVPAHHRDCPAGDYAADASAGELAGFVHVEASWQGRGPMGPAAETRWLESLGAPKLLGIVGHADLTLPCLGWNYHAGTPPSANEVANDLAPLVEFTIDTFGAGRCMFASNFPVDKVSMSWATLYDAFHQTVADRSEAERRALFGDTAVAAYRLEP